MMFFAGIVLAVFGLFILSWAMQFDERNNND